MTPPLSSQSQPFSIESMLSFQLEQQQVIKQQQLIIDTMAHVQEEHDAKMEEKLDGQERRIEELNAKVDSVRRKWRGSCCFCWLIRRIKVTFQAFYDGSAVWLVEIKAQQAAVAIFCNKTRQAYYKKIEKHCTTSSGKVALTIGIIVLVILIVTEDRAYSKLQFPLLGGWRLS